MEEVVVSKSPERISNAHNFGVTPFGVYCFECGVPIGKGLGENVDSSLRMHVGRKSHKLPNDTPISTISDSLMKAMSNRFGHVRNYILWVRETGIERYKCSCGVSFAKKSNYQRHAKRAEKDNPESSHCLSIVKSVSSVCGRVIEETKIKEMMGRSLCVTANNDTNTSVDYIPIQWKNKKWITMQLVDIKKIFAPYKRPNESLDPYLASLKLLTIHENDPVIGSITNTLNLLDGDRSKNDKGLNFFMDCAEKWVKNYCREHVNVLDGQTRFHLQSYFDESVLVNPGYKLNFNMREKEDVILKEVMLIIEFSWKIHENGLSGDILNTTITEIKNEIDELEKLYGGIASDTAVQAMIQGLFIQRYLHSILIETMDNAFFLLLGHHIIMLRLFKVKKTNTNEGDGYTLSMRSCGEFGSIISLHVHIYRLATASLLACTERRCWDGILNEAKNAPLCHMVSPLINKTKNMNNEKIKVRKKQLKANGDIVIDEFNFPKCSWCKIVPKLLSMFNPLLDSILSDSQWRLLINTNNDVHVTRMEDEHEWEKDELLHYNFYTNVNGKVVSEKDLFLRKEIEAETIEKLTGLVMICLHGLGLGSARVTELFRIQQHQLYWKGGNFYYITISNKRRSSKTNNKTTVTHKLPSCISRYLLLYDRIGMEISNGREQFLFSYDCNDIGGNYKNDCFYDQFASIFELPSNCCCLVMRHLYTSICNYVFPNNNNNIDSSIVSTVGEVAEMSGHSLETHEQYYSSLIDKEALFDKYHQSIGAELTLENMNTVPLGLATEMDVLHCLRVLMGMNSKFLSSLQRNMIMDSCNNVMKHTFCSIGCGGGKSMSWIIPTLRQHLTRSKSKLSIVVIPYCFLLDHHVNSTKKLFGSCHRISIHSLKGRDIEDNILPNLLRDKDSLPSILFVSLEAIRILFEYHRSCLEELQKDDLIFKIYVDECHTILSELNFRDSYSCLAKLARLNIPMAVFSGSFQRAFIKDFVHYMFGSDDTGMYNMYIDTQIFGNKLMKLTHIASKNYMAECCNHLEKYVNEFKKSSVHVIVSTKNEGKY